VIRRFLAALLIAIVLTLCVVYAQAKDLGSFGKTYPIAEKDALVEIEEKARLVDWKTVLDKKKPEKYQPPDKIHLPRATKNQTRFVDMSYTAEMDVPDGKGGILYPKGYSFNPLEYVTYPKTIVVINGKDKKQVKWFKTSEYSKRIDVMLLLTEGSFPDIAKQIDRNVFYANEKIIRRFQLKVVPSVVRQSRKNMEILEIVPESNNKESGR